MWNWPFIVPRVPRVYPAWLQTISLRPYSSLGPGLLSPILYLSSCLFLYFYLCLLLYLWIVLFAFAKHSSAPHFILYLLSCYFICTFVFGPCRQVHLYISLCLCLCLLSSILCSGGCQSPWATFTTRCIYIFICFFILPSAPYFTCTGLPIWPSNWCLPLLVADITAITVVTLQIYKISPSSTHLYSAQLSKTASAYKWPSIVSYASLSGHTLDHMLPLTAQAFWDCANFLFTWRS